LSVLQKGDFTLTKRYLYKDPRGKSYGKSMTGKSSEPRVNRTVVDADVHTTESFEEVLPYLKSKYKGLRRIIDGSQVPRSEVFSVMLATPPTPPEDGRQTEYFGKEEGPEEKSIRMDDLGIDSAILKPTLFNTITGVHNSRFAVALANAYNSWLVDTFQDYSDELKSVILVAPQKPHKAAEEIDQRADEDLFVGVGLPGSLVPPAGHEMYRPIFQAAEDNGLPLAVHPGLNDAFRIQYSWNNNWTEDHATYCPFTMMWNLTTMVLRGIPERFPSLDFVFSDAGIGWVPYMLRRLDGHYHRYSHELSIDDSPSDYIRQDFTFTTHPVGHSREKAPHLASVIDQVGVDSIAFSSNLPHHDFDRPGKFEQIVSNDFEDKSINKLMGLNTKEIFGIS